MLVGNVGAVPDDDYFDDDPADSGSPLHPDDRLWRHPSEMRSVPPAGSRSIPDTVDFAPLPRRRPMWHIVAASSLVGAAVAISVVMATGMGQRVVERLVEPPPPDVAATTTTTTPPTTSTEPPSAPALAEMAAAAQASMAWITVSNGDRSIDCAAVIIRSDGHLVTDARPFSDGALITVRFHDGTTETGHLVAIDPLTELAVIKVDRDDLEPAETSDASEVKVGQFALLLGPDETGSTTASAAMINAVGTPARLADGVTLYGMIRFEATVPMEMSGGPLLNDVGKVIGVTARAGNGNPHGLATPIGYARIIAEDLIREGRAMHPWLGIEGRRNNGEPVIVSVVEGSPGAIAGLAADDVILAVDGEAMASMAALVTAVRAKRPGDELTITYRRGDEERVTVVTLGLRDQARDSQDS